MADIAHMLKKLDAEPLRIPGESRRLTEGLATYGVLSALYDKGSWSYLEDGLRELRDGSGTTLLALADSLSGRRPDGTYDNSTDALNAIGCIDQPWPRGVSAYRTAAKRAALQSPPFGADLVWTSLPCAYWPVKSPSSPPKLTAAEAAVEEADWPANDRIAAMSPRELVEYTLPRAAATAASPAFRALVARVFGSSVSHPALMRTYWQHYIVPRRAATATLLEQAKRRGTLPTDTDVDVLIDMMAGAVTYRILQPDPPDTTEMHHYLRTLYHQAGLL